MAESDFWEKFFSGQKCRKYAGNRRFCRFWSDFFPWISLFFPTKTLLIAMPTIKYDSIVNKTDFWSWNFLKIARTANFNQKSGVSWIFQAALYIFSWNFAHWCKMVISKVWLSLIFEKHTFPAKKSWKYTGKTGFGHFLQNSSLVFSHLLKDAY